MDSLFPEELLPETQAPAPLAQRMRPRTFDEFIGQEALLAPGKPLREAIERDLLQSIILWGPPGTGKTTLARIIADTTKARFVSFSAVLSGIKEIRDVMAVAEQLRRTLGRRTIVFIDEIHRFNKAQQDAFLPRVEAGDIVLIGATTENPSFEVNAALLSRSKVFVLRGLTADEIETIVTRALEDPRARPRSLARGRRLCRHSRDCDVRERRRTGGAESSRAERRGGSGGGGRTARRHGPRRAGHPAARPALRQGRRGALQPDLGAPQVDAQQRSGRGGLLARADARSRRGSDATSRGGSCGSRPRISGTPTRRR